MKQCFVCILSGRLANSSPSYAEVEGAKLKFVCTQKNLFCVIKGHGQHFLEKSSMQQMALSSGDRYGSNTTDTNPIFRMVVTFERF